MQRKYGWIKQEDDPRDHRVYNVFGLAAPPALPAYHRIVDGMPPVWDQGETNTCSAQASAAAYEYMLVREALNRFMPSRMFQYYNSRLLEGTTNTDAGATIRDAVKALAKYGTLPEDMWPFSESYSSKPSPNVYAQAQKGIVTNYAMVNQDIDSLKRTLFSNQPVIFGFMVPESFESAAMAQSGIMRMPGSNETILGGHAVLAEGYDDGQQAVWCRNSWGDQWGRQGSFLMPYAFISDPKWASDFWIIQHED